MTLFERYFIRHLLQEDNTTATGGVWGDGASIGQPSPYSSDFYAPGDARNVFGSVTSKTKKKKKKKRKSRKKKVGEGPVISIQRRNLAKGSL
jgi:hypothetical protein